MFVFQTVRLCRQESIHWKSRFGCQATAPKSDEEADSWLETVTRFIAEQLEILKASEMTKDNVTILCDGYWRREFLKPEADRNWDHVALKL